MSSEKRFGYEWNKYQNLDANYEIQFKKWITPLQPKDFKGKKVLDAGCGMGRNSFWVKKWGAKEVIAFDHDERSVEAAKKNLSEFENIKVEFKNIYEIDWKNEFDLVFSIGVIHHLLDPLKAVKKLIEAVKPGGKILIWVYGYEGNEWIVKFVNPIRKNLTSKMPINIIHFLSYFVSIPLWLWVKVFRGPSAYLKQLSGFKFWHIHSIVFDQFIPEIANYWRKEEAISLLAKNYEIECVQIYHINNNSWTVLGQKKKV